MKRKKFQQRKESINTSMSQEPEIPSDVLGSYTGTPISDDPYEKYEMPIQDADDL